VVLLRWLSCCAVVVKAEIGQTAARTAVGIVRADLIRLAREPAATTSKVVLMQVQLQLRRVRRIALSHKEDRVRMTQEITSIMICKYLNLVPGRDSNTTRLSNGFSVLRNHA